MKKFILAFFLITGLGFGQIPEDESVRTLKQRLTARRQFLQNNPGAREIFRSENAIHFEREPGRRTAIIQRDVAYVDPDSGELKPVDLDLIETRLGYRTTGSPVVIRIVVGVLQTSRVQTFFKNPQTKLVQGYTITTPRLTYKGDFDFGFEQDGLNWTLQVQEFGWDIRATVTAPQGAKLYRFGFAELNMELAPDADGNLATPDGLYKISRPVMVRADGVQTPCSAWQVERLGFCIGFTCDDTGFPVEAYPYVIDPTGSYNPTLGTDDGYVSRSGFTWPLTWENSDPGTPACLYPDLIVEDMYSGSWYRVTQTLIRFNTADLPDNSLITNAQLVLTPYSKTSATYCNVYIDDIPAETWPITVDSWIPTSDLSGSVLSAPMTDVFPVNQAYPVSVQTTKINLTGYTAFRIGMRCTQSPLSGPNLRFRSSEWSTTEQRPKLVVDYQVVGGPKLIIVQQGE